MDHDTFGLWTGQAPPSGPACADWAASHAGDSVHVKAGSLVCLRTRAAVPR
ncbi:Serine/threonine protein kinase OS=Kitasatospora aureofaciens OX=1894 GN=HS99_0027995 PE=4 SV=1 [Kitasatospora aureofaciens]